MTPTERDNLRHTENAMQRLGLEVRRLKDTNADLLTALEAVANEPLTNDPEATVAECFYECVRIATAAIAKARASH